MNNDNNQTAKNKTAVIVGLGVALALGVVVLTVALASVLRGGLSGKESTTLYGLTSGVFNSTTQADTYFSGDVLVENSNAGYSENANENTVNNQQSADTTHRQETEPQKTTENNAVKYYESLSKNGDNMLSDHCENEFIKLVSSRYGVDSDLLVAIYSVPDTGNNFVLQFNDKKDSSGNIIKSPDTLEKVYQIDKDRNVKIATGTQSGNVGVSYAEGLFCFNMVKTLVMEQYPDYFTGLKD